MNFKTLNSCFFVFIQLFLMNFFITKNGSKYCFSTRYYDPKMSRFISSDPIIPKKDSQGMNRYAYVFNKPLKLTDPSGNIPYLPNSSQDSSEEATPFSLILPEVSPLMMRLDFDPSGQPIQRPASIKQINNNNNLGLSLQSDQEVLVGVVDPWSGSWSLRPKSERASHPLKPLENGLLEFRSFSKFGTPDGKLNLRPNHQKPTVVEKSKDESISDKTNTIPTSKKIAEKISRFGGTIGFYPTLSNLYELEDSELNKKYGVPLFVGPLFANKQKSSEPIIKPEVILEEFTKAAKLGPPLDLISETKQKKLKQDE